MRVAARKETPFLSDLVHSLNNQGGNFFKIPDSGLQQRFAIKKPYDIVGRYGPLYVAIEGKFLQKYQPFGVKELAEHQLESLLSVWTGGAHAYVALGIKAPRNAFYRLLMFDIETLVLKDRYTTAELKEYPYIQAHVEYVETKTGGLRRVHRFDMETFLEGI